MKANVQRIVWERARFRCEYCKRPAWLSELPFVIDHIFARQHLGESDVENLAFCCGFCNRHKGPNVAGVDPDSKTVIPLFHPRHDRWTEHFRWDNEMVVGLTPTGRVTVHVLAMNHPIQIAVRAALVADGFFLYGEG